MRMAIVILMFVVGAFQSASRNTGAIEGRVARASNDAPVSGARVVLVPQQAVLPTPAPPEIAAITDDDGMFRFKNLAPGQYMLRATRDGYFGPLVNGAAPAVATEAVVVEADRTAVVGVGMVQGGIIHGLLRDPDGEPAVNYAFVTARPSYLNGRVIWQFSGTRNSDDRGEFRMLLPPGEYYVGSNPRAPGPIANIQDGWMPVFYPGTTDGNQALPLTLKEGGEVIVNLDTVRKLWQPRRISGVAVNPLPNPAPNSATGVVDRSVNTFLLVPHVPSPRDVPGVSSSTNLVASSTKPNGEFELRNVPPGRYELYGMVQDLTIRRIWTAHTTVDVQDKDITGVTLGLTAGATLNGEISVTGGNTPPLRLETLRLTLQALDWLPPAVTNAIGVIQVGADGKFSVPAVAEARYRINIAGLPQTAYVSDIQAAGRSVFDDGLIFNGREQASIEIVVGATGGIVEGTVQGNNSRPAAGATVALVPAASRRQNPALYRTAITDENGRFVLEGVAPGQYTAFAWEYVLSGAWQNAEFIGKNQSLGRPVSVAVPGRTVLQLDLIRAE